MKVEQFSFGRLVFQREAGLDAVIGAVSLGKIADEVYAYVGRKLGDKPQ